jgi:hypothetical protein
MAPNPDKCEVVVFNDPGWPLRDNNTAWVLNGTPLKKSTEFSYLGVLFTGGHAWGEGRMVPAWLNQREKGQRALYAFLDKCHSAHLTPQTLFLSVTILWCLHLGDLAVRYGDRESSSRH